MKPFVCKSCGDKYDAPQSPDGVCERCRRKARFAAFAAACGLECYPDPAGERYLYDLDGGCAGKKGERVGFMDDLWDALVRAKGGDASLLIDRD